jgi:hypothetical protein
MNELSSLSRRRWLNSGLATCGFLAAGGLGLAQALEMPALKGYTRPGPVTERDRAPGLQSRLISEIPAAKRPMPWSWPKATVTGLTDHG